MSTLLLAGAALAVGLLGLVVMVHAARLALVGWLVAVCAVPVWAGVTVVIVWEPHVLASLGMTVALVLSLLSGRGRVAGRITWADGLMVAFVAAALVPALAGRGTITDVFELVVQWTGAYLAGRLVGHRVPLRFVHGAVAVAFTLVALLALTEFLTQWNPFVQFPGSGPLRDAWAPIQLRGGQARSEGAFGHSIALGASLALAVPITLVAPFRAAIRLVMVALMLGATVVTFSRVGLLTAAVGVVLTVLVSREQLSARVRWAVVGGALVVAGASSSLLAGVFTAAGSEATDSADYRVDLLSLLPSVRFFGQATSLHRLPTGEKFFGSFHSIDNALLLVALHYGWVPTALVVLLLAAGAWCVLTRRATAPTIAVIAQLPAFVSVALITQYATVTWFIAGLAVFSQSVAQRRPRVGGPPGSDVAPTAGASPGMAGAHPDLVGADAPS